MAGNAESWKKLLAATLVSYFGLSWLDKKFLIANDLALAIKSRKILQFARNKPGTNYTITDAWRETLQRVEREKACIINASTGETLSFDEVDKRSNQVANWAVAQGYKEKDCVALFMENRPEFIITLLGLTKAGLVIALINSNNKMKPLLHSIRIAHCVCVIFGSELAVNVHGVLPELQSINVPLFSVSDSGLEPPSFAKNATAEINSHAVTPVCDSRRANTKVEDNFGYIYTSGTTGLPKACAMTHLKYIVGGSTLESIYSVTQNDVIYTVLPLYHSAGGMLGVGALINTGVTMVVARKFSASRFWKDCTIFKVTVTQYIGELCRYLVNSPVTPFDRAHSVRIAVGNGLRREVWPEFQKRFNIPEIGEFYGATEGNVAFFNHSQHGKGVGAVGRSGAILKKVQSWKLVKHDVATESPIRGKDGFCIEVGPGEQGELLGCVKVGNALSQFKGYTSREATKKKVLTDVLEKGDIYFRTGDLLRHDLDGYLYFVDRIGDTFRWKGENVSTNEVSEVVSVFPGILEANVYGVKVPGNEDGRACMAAIVTAGGKRPDFEALYKHIAVNLASYAMPQFIRLLPEMESTGTFKQRKVSFVQQGIDLDTISDPMWWLDASDRSNPQYKPLTAAVFARLASGAAKL